MLATAATCGSYCPSEAWQAILAAKARTAPHVRHNVDTESSASRERVVRPYGAKPRTPKGWS